VGLFLETVLLPVVGSGDAIEKRKVDDKRPFVVHPHRGRAGKNHVAAFAFNGRVSGHVRAFPVSSISPSFVINLNFEETGNARTCPDTFQNLREIPR